MKLKKAIRKLSNYLDADRREQLREYDSIKKLLKELKEKRDKIIVKIAEAEDDDEILKLQAKLEIVAAHRKKGINLLKDLKKSRDS